MAPFTANCDIFVAIHEDGLNLIARHVMRQRPSLFNYATQAIAVDPQLWCAPVDVSPDVATFHNPTFAVEAPLPVLGTMTPPAGLNWSVQITRLRLDVHPGNVVNVPVELNPPLAVQHFALEAVLLGQIDCPGPEQLRQAEPSDTSQRERYDAVVLSPSRGRDCFNLGIVAVGRVGVETINNASAILARIDDVDIVGLGGEPLEDAVSCYVKTTLNLVLFQRLNIALSTFLLHFDILGGTISSTLAPPPPNPALQHDRIELFVNLGFS